MTKIIGLATWRVAQGHQVGIRIKPLSKTCLVRSGDEPKDLQSVANDCLSGMESGPATTGAYDIEMQFVKKRLFRHSDEDVSHNMYFA